MMGCYHSLKEFPLDWQEKTIERRYLWIRACPQRALSCLRGSLDATAGGSGTE